MKNIFRGKIILITGAAGTIGQELLRQLIPLGPSEIRTLDHNESAQFMMGEQYRHLRSVKLTTYLGDVIDVQKLSGICWGVNILIHCAALKHVYLSEYNPFDAVQTNIIGVKNIINAAIDKRVEKVIFTSSDKAVNPSSVMGTSKLMGERLITAANVVNTNPNQRFFSVRFGNVIGSRGSVFQIFNEQIKEGGPVTVTEKEMTRFFMSVGNAARMVLKGAGMAKGGEVLITKMAVIKIIDLAEAMIELLAPYYGHTPESIKIKIIGAKPGEKMYEELLSDEEVRRSWELKKLFVVLPAFRAIYHNINYEYVNLTGKKVDKSYISSREEALTKKQIKSFLVNNQLLP